MPIRCRCIDCLRPHAAHAAAANTDCSTGLGGWNLTHIAHQSPAGTVSQASVRT